MQNNPIVWVVNNVYIVETLTVGIGPAVLNKAFVS